MKTICIIPAKGKSRGIPNKNLIDFCGESLLAWTMSQARDSLQMDNIYVSSDSNEILSLATVYGIKRIQRPEELALDNTSTEEVVLHALDAIKANDEDIIVLLQATSPLRENDDIKKAIDLFTNKRFDSLFSISIVKDNTIWKLDTDRRLLVGALFDNFDRKQMRQDRQDYYYENGSIYVFTAGNIRRYKNRIAGVAGMYVMPFWKSFEIDEEEDIELVEFYFKKKILKE